MTGPHRLNFAFIGAGSGSFTLRVVSEILRQGDWLAGGDLRLVDTNPEALETAHAAVGALIRKSEKDFAVTRCADYHEALPGLDFLYFTFLVGGYALWKEDIAISTRHGVLHTLGDTTGPGGLMRTLRNAPVALDIARAMEKACPNAWAINCSNPVGSLGLVIVENTGIRTFGQCAGTENQAERLARHVFEVDKARVQYQAGGINHFTFFTRLAVDGKDALPGLRERLIAAGYHQKEPIAFEIFERYGLYPAPNDCHAMEFFSCYLRPRVLREKNYAHQNNDFAWVDQHRQHAAATMEKVIRGEIGADAIDAAGETSMRFVRALCSGGPIREMTNVANKGYIDNISDGLTVEVPVFADAFGLHPQHIGPLPEGIAARCEAVARAHRLAARAGVACDRNLALQALLLDPLAAHCDYPEALLDDLLRASRDCLPDAWGLS